MDNGREGNSWSSSSIGKSVPMASYLRFLVNDVDPMFGYYRPYGFPVRCVQELAVSLSPFYFLLLLSDSDKSGV